MRPLTDHTAKPLLKVGGVSLIEWILRALSHAGFRRVVINVAYMGEQIERELGNGAAWGLEVIYSREVSALETAGGIARALPLLGDTPFLVVNGDVWTDFDFSQFSHDAWCLARQVHLVMVPNPPQHTQGDFYLERADALTKCASVVDVGENTLTFSGIAVYSPRFFAEVDPNAPARLAPLLRAAIRAGEVTGQAFYGRWMDIGTPERLVEWDRVLTNP